MSGTESRSNRVFLWISLFTLIPLGILAQTSGWLEVLSLSLESSPATPSQNRPQFEFATELPTGLQARLSVASDATSQQDLEATESAEASSISSPATERRITPQSASASLLAAPDQSGQLLAAYHEQTPVEDYSIRQVILRDSDNRRPETNQLPIDLTRVDELLREGQYPKAADLLKDFQPRASGLLHAQIGLRRALCEELRGNTQLALDHYRELTGKYASSAVADAATVATARVLIQRDHREAGTSMLMRLLLRRERVMRRDLLGDVVHTLAAGLLPMKRQPYLLDESEWLTAERTQIAGDLLKSWAVLDTTEPVQAEQEKLELRELTATPEGIFVTLHANSANPAMLLNTLCTRLRWSGQMNVAAEKALRAHTISVNCADLPLDVTLDLLLQPMGFRWEFNNQVLIVTTSDPVGGSGTDTAAANEKALQEFATADRFLQLAVGVAPEHAAAPLSYILLGSTAARRGDFERAVHFFEMSVEQFPRSAAIGAAMFNRGKAALNQGDRETALAQFYRTVDRVSGLEADTVAYLFIGRILIENDTPHEAIRPLMRGLALSENTVYEAPAALLLSAAYLLSGNVAGANSVLLEHRLAFTTNTARSERDATRLQELADQAAFLSSLVRFWGSTGTQRVREARGLLSALTNVKPEKMFGGHAAYLVGIAFDAVGLNSEQQAVFHRSLAQPHSFELQQRMVALLNGDLRAEDSLQVPRPQSADGNESQSTPGSWPRATAAKTALVAAEAAYRLGNYDEVRRTCHQALWDGAETQATVAEAGLSQEERQIRRALLRFLGLAYQSQGLHEQAVRCFAGTVPTPPVAIQNQPNTTKE